MYSKDTAIEHYDVDVDKCDFKDGEVPVLFETKPLVWRAKVIVERLLLALQPKIKKVGAGWEFTPADPEDMAFYDPFAVAFRYGVRAVENLEIDDQMVKLRHQADGGIRAEDMELLEATIPGAILEIGGVIWAQAQVEPEVKN